MKLNDSKYLQQKYFNISDDYCSYMEENAKKVMEVYRQNYLTNKKNAELLWVILIIGLLLVFMMLIKGIAAQWWSQLNLCLLVLVILWSYCSYRLFNRCITLNNIPMSAVSPCFIYMDDPLHDGEKMSFSHARRFQLYRMDDRIVKMAAITNRLAFDLNKIRKVVILSPALAGLSFLVGVLFAEYI